ncbi:MAG: alpha/beta hydrolase [Kiritimatiellia bacterium]
MKRTLLVLVAVCAGWASASFGPLNPSARPHGRDYIWPEGRMPHAQAHQIAAKTGETKRPGFNPDAFRRPYIEWFAPNPDGKTDLCVLVVSGGGFDCCCDEERLQPAIDRLVRDGVTVANLTYRTPRPHGLPIHQSAWEDAQRAVRVIRSQAAARGFDPEKIGATGISAGAKTVLLLATSALTPAYAPVDEIDRLPCHLLFAVPQAPAYVLTDGASQLNARDGDAPDVRLVPELAFDARTCPMAFVQGGVDTCSPNGSTQIYRQLRRMKIPAELHLFPDRPHGFHGDLNRGEDGAAHDHWFARVQEFIRQMGYDGRLGPEVEVTQRYSSDAARGGYEKQDVWPKGRMPDVQTNQCVPYLEWHLPKELKTKAVQIIYSGGGYGGNSPDSFEVAPARRFLNEKGMTVVTLRYRTPRPLNGLAKHTTAWQDLQRTIRVVRTQAAARGLDPNRIGIMGSSAGGHLTLMGATSSRHRAYWPVDDVDRQSCKVQWAVAIYPAYALTDGLDRHNATGGNDDSARLAPEFSFDLDTCPILFIHGDADGWAAMNSVKCWEQLRRMGIQGALHTLATRTHCFQRKAAPGTGSYTWLGRIWEFMNHKGFNN